MACMAGSRSRTEDGLATLRVSITSRPRHASGHAWLESEEASRIVGTFLDMELGLNDFSGLEERYTDRLLLAGVGDGLAERI